MTQPWWQTGAIYQIYPRSFADSNGDGIGDLAGITAKLGYLADLGIAAIWLSPFYPSPMDDFGYDVTDHTGVDPLFGTVADAEELIEAAHRHGLRVLVDFIPNHTSHRHPWFEASRSGRDHTDWYYWRCPAPDGGPPNNWLSLFGGPAWTFDAERGEYYYHAYLPEQPDLNWRNPAVRAAQYDVLRTWLDRGVDGFRIDAFRQLLKDPQWRDNPPNPDWLPGDDPYLSMLPVHSTDQPDITEVIAELRSVLTTHARVDEPVLMAEIYLPLDKLLRYHAGIHLPSNMELLSTPWTPEAIAHLAEEYEELLPSDAWPNWTTGNHDRSRIASRIGSAQAGVAAMLLLTLRGTPILYYGEELGMCDIPIPPTQVQDPVALRLPDQAMGRDPERTPMHWTDAPHAGFCPANVVPWLPTEPHPPGADVASQERSETSVLALYRSLLRLRQSSDALRSGSYRTILASDSAVVIALNFSDQAQPIILPGDPQVALSTQAGPGPTTLRPHEGLVMTQPRTSR